MAHTPHFRQFLLTLQKARQTNQEIKGEPLPLTREEALRRGISLSSRRHFIKMTALASGTAIATTTLSHWEKVWSKTAPNIAIVGGGMAGLNAAYQLKKAGLRATVYEARNRLGGRIFSPIGVVGDGLVMDLGGSFINTDHEDILGLVKEFDLELFDRLKDVQESSLPETAYYFDGRTPSEAEVAEKLRPLAQQISQDADLIDQDFDRFAPQFDSLSVSAYLDQHADKIPAPFIRILIESTIRTEYGVEPEQSSALQLLFTLPTVEGKKVDLLGYSDEQFVVKGGSGRIIDSLGAALGDQIQMGMGLIQIKEKGATFHLSFAEKSVIEADWVILAIPFTVLRDVKIEVNLPAKMRRLINEVSLGFNEKLIAGFNSKIWQQPNGFRQEVWTDLDFSQAWNETQRQPDKQAGALTFFFGGKQVALLQSEIVATQGKKIIDQFETVRNGVKMAANGRFSGTEWTKDPLTKGGYTSFKPRQLTEFAEFLYIESQNPQERQEVRVRNLVFAGEQFSDEFYGFMNGAAQTGRLAAEIIIRES